MGTQGVVSITRDGNTFIKAICGCEGYNANELLERLADIIQCKCPITPQTVYKAALASKFGCGDCLVVMSETEAVFDFEGKGDLPSSYRTTFDDPKFNPRWGYGGNTEYVEVIDINLVDS